MSHLFRLSPSSRRCGRWRRGKSHARLAGSTMTCDDLGRLRFSGLHQHFGSVARKRTTYTKKHPLVTSLVGNFTLSRPRSAKDMRQLVFRLPADTLSYEAADALGVWPHNGDRLVDEWLTVTELDGDTAVEVADHESMSLRDALNTDSRSPTSARTCFGSCSSARGTEQRGCHIDEAGKQSRAG